MLGAGKDAAKRLYEDLVLSDEEKAKREAAREAAARRKRRKWIALGVGSIVALLALFMIITKYLPWAIAFAVLAGLGYYGYRRVRGRTCSAAADAPRRSTAAAARASTRRPPRTTVAAATRRVLRARPAAAGRAYAAAATCCV